MEEVTEERALCQKGRGAEQKSNRGTLAVPAPRRKSAKPPHADQNNKEIACLLHLKNTAF
jgi:hypothetical protein